MAIGYMYDDTFRLIGPVPLASNPKRYGEYLVPSNCTTIEPPTGYGEELTPAFNRGTGQWDLVKSYYALEMEDTYREAVSPTGAPLYEQDIEGNWILRDAAIVQAEDDANNAAANYDLELQNLKVSMDEAILNKAMEITKGTSLPSVQSFLSAYQLRALKPSEYVSEGLIVRWAIDTYALGDALDTDLKIEDYYSKILIYMDKFREEKIGEYLAAKAALPTP